MLEKRTNKPYAKRYLKNIGVIVDVLNNREVAITLWFLVFSVYVIFFEKMTGVRKSIKKVFSAFFARKIMFVVFCMVAYMGCVIYGLSKLQLWNSGQIKSTVFWFSVVGVVSIFKIEKIKNDKSFFIDSVIDNLKLLAIIEFVVGVYTFSLWIEIALVPVLVLFGSMLAVAGDNKEYQQVKGFLENCLSFFGVFLIAYTVFMLTAKFGEFANKNTAYDFFVPPLLTLCYLPFLFFTLVYSTYEQVFVRLKFSIRDRFLRYAAKFYAFILFNVHLSLLER